MDHAQINATIEANNAAVAAGDIEAILAAYEPTGALVADPGKLAQGTAALREAFGHFMAMNPSISVAKHEVIQADDIALHTSTWKMTGLAPDGSAFEQTGFSVVVLRKQADGRWLMVIDNPFGDNLLQAD
jgi:uncharacterized protein (TIGR02246 family)